MQERFAAASRPGPGQWAAVAGALELRRRQLSQGPTPRPAHRWLKANGPGGSGEEGCDPPPTTFSAVRTTVKLTGVGAGPPTAALRVTRSWSRANGFALTISR